MLAVPSRKVCKTGGIDTRCVGDHVCGNHHTSGLMPIQDSRMQFKITALSGYVPPQA